MSAPSWARVAELFEQAVALDPGQRTRFLENACQDQPDLIARVRDLLGADARSFPLLDATPDRLAAALSPAATSRGHSWRVGPYLIRRELGRGGMGVVYLAEREDLGTVVALKLVLSGPASPERVAWFRREQVVHAQLEHPHIARVLDAGVADDGTPWFALEYVEGTPIDRHADTRRLGLRQRLELFEKVAVAVAHAHRNLIVHRDLKPSNVLVRATGEPKLVDFGIAKLLSVEGPGGETTSRGPAGVMTLAYAAPEQLRADPVTVATDVYQLGILLHELLTGLPPCLADGRILAPGAKLTDIAPAPPSSLAQLNPPDEKLQASAGTAQTRSAARSTTPDRLRRLLEGDLDTIVLKALRPDPTERYRTAEAMVDDVRNYLEGRPILARPGSAAYRLGKLLKRHRVASALAALLLVLIAGGTVLLGIQARRVARERDRAEQVSRVLEGLLYRTDPLIAADTLSERSVLEATAREARARVEAEPEVWGRLLVVVGRIYQTMGWHREATELQTLAVSALRRVGEPQAPILVDGLRSLGTLEVLAGDTLKGYATLDEALRLARELGPAGRDRYAKALADVGFARNYRGDLDGARTRFRTALEMLVQLPDSGGSDLDQIKLYLGNLLIQGAELDEAERLFREAVARRTARDGPTSGGTLYARTQLADLLIKRGHLTEAEQLTTEVLATWRRINPGPHEQIAEALMEVARVSAEQGQGQRAEAAARAALSMWRELHGAEDQSTAYGMVQLADVLKRFGKAPEAADLEREALRQFRLLAGETGTPTVYTMARLAHTEHLLGHVALAERLFREALPRLDSTPAGQARLIRPYMEFGGLLADVGRCDEAFAVLGRAARLAEQALGPAHPSAIRPRRLQGVCLTKTRRFDDAEALLLKTYADAQASGDYARELTAEVSGSLVALYRASGRDDRTRLRD